ncbi:hypothetical protein TRVA0_032S00166 [Trichomonascus vanleenenianus]|uniref:endoplasmic reticulum resident protein 29 n=1 Tax=Trichomonascus vanleenenianus TaxID=2268995 RepID=UPI003EC9ABB4
MKFTNFLAALAAACAIAEAAAIEATDKTLQSYLDKKIPTLLDLYASWCGHCKTLSPIYDELADSFAHVEDKIQIIKIDADKHRKAAKKFDVEYFPTLKFINADGSVEEAEGRDLSTLTEIITKKTGLRPRLAKEAPSAVVSLNDGNFDDIVGKGKKPALVAFTATWCGHCKKMKPEFEAAAEVFARDDVTIALVDCTDGSANGIASQFGVSAYPTILYFDGKSSEPVPYAYGRSVDHFVDFVNERAGTARTVEGKLTDEAGRVASLDALARRVVGGGEAAVNSVVEAASQAAEKSAKWYGHYAKRIADKGERYISKEIARLTKLMSGSSVGLDKQDEFKVKINILNVFGDNQFRDEL